MNRVILLDAGPLGMITHPRDNRGAAEWLARLLWNRAAVRIPEIADYELRRELLRARKARSIDRLDGFKRTLGFVPLTSDTMLLAADLWARIRRAGRPTADDTALDGDVILAAQALLLASSGDEVIIATTNVKHLSIMADARVWSTL